MRAFALKAGAEPGRAGRFGEWHHKGRRLIVVICPKRAREDALARPLDKVDRSDMPKELLTSHGAKRFIAAEGDAALTVNPVITVSLFSNLNCGEQ